MKQNLLYLVLLFSGFFVQHNAYAQTMQAGDIAFIGYTTDDPDGFTFIALKDLPAGETIYFTDEGWETTVGWNNPFEPHLEWVIPAGTTIGTIVSVVESSINTFTVTGSTNGVTMLDPSGSATTFALSAGDQVLAYQSSTGARPASPTFISGVHGDYNNTRYDAVTTWNDQVPVNGGSESMLPTGLTNGVDCVSLFPAPGPELDNNKYVGILTGTASFVRAVINDPTNWSGTDNSGIVDITATTYATPNVTPDAAGGTTLTDGDIAITRINNDNPDTYSFLILTDIESGTEILFTTEYWGTNVPDGMGGNIPGPAFSNFYFTIQFTATSDISAGEEVHINGDLMTVTFSSGSTLGTISSLGPVNPFEGNLFHSGGDCILVFQGSKASPTFIAGISNETGVSGTSGDAWQTNFSVNDTQLPAGKVNGQDGWLGLFPFGTTESDNCRYKETALHTGTKEAVMAAIMDVNNWEFDNAIPWGESTETFSISSVPACTMTASISSQTDVACNGGATGSLTVTPTDGTGPYTYLWDDGSAQTTATATGLAAGTYEVIVTDDNGCTDTASATITQPASALSANGVGTDETCAGNNGYVDLTVTGGTAPYTFVWSNAATTEDIIGLAPGTYDVTVTDANGCTATESVTINAATACPALATVTTDAITVYTTSSFTVGGDVTDNGNVTVTERGIVYSTSANPTTADNTVQMGTGEGVFSQSVSGLSSGVTYYVRAYAINSEGTAYGNEVVFTAPYGVINLVHDATTTQYPTIQQAVDASVTGDMVTLGTGTYIEQVTVTTGITIQGASTTETIVRSPLAANLTVNGGWKTLKAQDVIAIIGIKTDDASQVTIKDLVVDGFDQGYLPDGTYPNKEAYAFQGIGALNTNLIVDNVNVTGVRELATDFGATIPAGYLPADQPSGLNHNEAIFAESAISSGNHTLEVKNSYIEKFQKTAILAWGPTLEVNIHDNTIQGYGQTLYSTGNGIQIASTDRTSLGGDNGNRRGTTGIITNNQILGIGVVIPEPGQDGSYLNLGMYGPSAILPSEAGDNFVISNNTITRTPYQSWYNDYISNDGGFSNTAIAVYNSNNASVTGNTISGFDVAIAEIGAVNGSEFNASGNTVSDNRNDYFTAQNNDHIVLGSSAEILTYYATSQGVDLIDNFGIDDRINVVGMESGSINGELSGNLIVDFTGGTVTAGDGSTVAANSIQVQQNATTTTLFIDTDATEDQAELKLELTGLYELGNFKLDGGFIVFTISPPTASAQAFCDAATVADLEATGTDLKWYDVATGGTLLVNNTDLSTGTYYVSQTVSGVESGRTSVAVTINPSPVASGVVDANVSCNGETDGGATASATGGTAPYTYVWSNGATTASIVGVAAGTYDLTITDDNGCTDQASVTITEPATLVASGVVDANVNCNGLSDGGATASATGGTAPYTYVWSNGATTASIVGVAAGTYDLTITDDNGCTDQASVTITEPATLVASGVVDANVNCNGLSDGGATASATGGTAPYTYVWSNAATTASIVGVTAGTYDVTITDDNGCTDQASVTITEPTALVASGVVDANVSCNGLSDGGATASVTGGTAPYTYVWSNGATTASIVGVTAGTYDVTITDDNGCTDQASVTITEPAALVASGVVDANVSCNGLSDGGATASVTGGTAPYTYVWSNGATTASIVGVAAGTYDVNITDANGCTDQASVTITEPATLVASGVVDANVSCNGETDGGATASATGGTAPYTYVWSNGATTASIVGVVAGTYDVTITDANGCTDQASVTITEPATLVASGVVDANVSCNGLSDGGATASATGGTVPYTYVWSNGATTASIVGVAAGTYDVNITDANGCTDQASVTITEPATLVASGVVDANVSCNGLSDGGATASATGGTVPYTYVWSNGATTASIVGVVAGTYDVNITDDNGCTDQASVTITEPATLVASGVVDANVSCNGLSDGGATASATGGTAPYTYVWSNGATTASIVGVTAGTYDVTITDDNGCTDQASVTITEPVTLVASGVVDANVSCNGLSDGGATASATGGTAPYTYVWSNGATTASIVGVAAGTYDVNITDANGCTDEASVTITEPTALVASGVVDANVSCNGLSDGGATASATGGTAPYTYVWSNGATTASIVGVAAGTYDVTITDANGCTDEASVIITEPAELVASGVVDANVSCNGGSNGGATASATGGTAPYTYVWSNAATTASIVGVAAGTYDVTITDANGCTATTSVEVTEPTIFVVSTIVTANATCNGGATGTGSITLSRGTAPYEYTFGNKTYSNLPDGTTISVKGLSAGTYDVTATDDNGCTASSSMTITEPTAFVVSTIVTANVTCNGGTTGTGSITLSGGTAPYEYTFGSKTYSNLPDGTTISVEGLSAGTYDVTATDDNGCTASSSMTITEPVALSANAVATNVSCNAGSNGAINLTVTGGTAPYTYVWSNAATTASIVGVAAGTYDVTITDANGCTDEASVTITEPATLVASGVVDANVSCNGLSDGGATASATGGTAPYTYVWSNAATTASIVGVTAGTYDVTITDDNGCTDQASVTITEPAALVASGVVDANVSCNGLSDGGATASATGGTAPYTYVWSNGATTASIVGVTAGTYDVTITDDNGCTDQASVTITEPAALSVNITLDNNLTCSDDNNGGATVEVTGGTAPYTYEWDNQATTASVTNLTLGNHSVTITDNNGCTATQTINIDFDDSILPVPDVSTLPNISEYCEVYRTDVPTPTATDNCSGTLMGTTNAIFPINSLGTTTITWTFKDEKGNKFIQQQDIIVKSSPLSDVSFGDATVTYDGTFHSIEVNGLPAEASASYQNNGQTDAGSYEVTATLNPGSSRCPSITLTAMLTIEKAEQTISFDEIPDKNLETDADFSLMASASSKLPVSYTYSYSADTPPAEVNETGDVSLLTSGTVEITAHQEGNANYSQATSVTRTLTIESSDATIHELTINGEVYDRPDNNIYYLIDCNDERDKVEIDFSTEANATGNTGLNFEIETPTPGIYRKEIQVTSQDDTNTRTYRVVVEKRFNYEDIVIQKYNNVLLVNNNPETNGGYRFTSFNWYKDGVLIGTGQYYSVGDNASDQLDLNAMYSVEMETEDGDILSTCESSITLKSAFVLKVAPNPVHSGSTIDVTTTYSTEMLTDLKITLSNLYGLQVMQEASGSNNSRITLPSSLTPGTYVVSTKAGGVELSTKIIVQ
nr:T9SS type A sorting domain-containing protein [uncultured Draconibacterium sp.]